VADESGLPGATWLGVTSSIGDSLLKILESDEIQPGTDLGYQLAKAIYLYHPLGQKMAEAPINVAQSQRRQITVQGAPEEVIKAFEAEWKSLSADRNIHNAGRLARVYGISAIVLGCLEVKPSEPLEMDKLWQQTPFFNVMDSLNTAGSLVLNQVPTAPDFNKPARVTVNGETFHRSRYVVMMNEEPIYLSFTSSAFGFSGRSVYQRALYPLKSFIRSMIADEMIATKLGLIIAKQKQPGSVINNLMQKVAGLKRAWLREAKSGNVISVDKDEDVETLNMQNVDGAGTYSRTNIIKNVATAADMPAKMLDNETLVAGFGEGTEDAKNIARYIERIREWLDPLYSWFDNIVQYRAWNAEFIARMQRKYPALQGREGKDLFSEWRESFAAEWPSLLIEPESERVKVDDVRLQATIATLQTLLPEVDPDNKATLIQWASDNINENKLLFPYSLDLDPEQIAQYQEKQAQLAQQNAMSGEESQLGPEAKRFGRFAGGG